MAVETSPRIRFHVHEIAPTLRWEGVVVSDLPRNPVPLQRAHMKEKKNPCPSQVQRTRPTTQRLVKLKCAARGHTSTH
jgi:hypothetical protein